MSMYEVYSNLKSCIEDIERGGSLDAHIAIYILSHHEEIPELSIGELAAACNTSPATISRFCRRVNDCDFRSLKDQIEEYNAWLRSEPARNRSHLKIDLPWYFDMVESSLYETRDLLDDALMDFSATQLLMRQPYLMLRYEILMYAVIEQQFVNLANMLTLEDDTGEQQIWVDYSMAEEIYPNLYPSMDSAVNLALSTDAGKTRLLVEVEIEGFSQKYQRTVNVGPEITYLMIKPPAMSGLTSLGSGRETQITLRVTQMDTGELLVAESKTNPLHSIYDFTMLNSEFGVIEPYNLLAWLRPDAEEVLALRREAIYWLETNAGAGYSSLPGYQLAYPDGTDEPSTTVLQAMAIQGAISDIGVRYNMGPYSFGGSQRVLTPDAVIQSRSGICIETALLMASALQSAQMHAMIIITPGHAQVALETWENSGTYYLLETTMLPYNATEEETMAFARYLTAEEWREYLSGDGVYVIDCDLAQTLGIRGLA